MFLLLLPIVILCVLPKTAMSTAQLLEAVESDVDNRWRWLSPLLARLARSLQVADGMNEVLARALVGTRAQRCDFHLHLLLLCVTTVRFCLTQQMCFVGSDSGAEMLRAMSAYIVDASDCLDRTSCEFGDLQEKLCTAMAGSGLAPSGCFRVTRTQHARSLQNARSFATSTRHCGGKHRTPVSCWKRSVARRPQSHASPLMPRHISYRPGTRRL